MKKLLLILMALFLWAGSSWGQVNNYAFSYSVGTYTAVSSGTQLIAANTDDASSAATNIGFNFVFNSTPFTQFVANSNGSIRLGSSAPTSAYLPISTTSNTNAIAFFARDGRAGGAVVYEITGTDPYRVLTIEYPGFFPAYGSATTYIDAQIKLFETTNEVQLIYGSSTRTTSYTAQVGLRGSTLATDYHNRTTATDWSATTFGATSSATMTLSTTVSPISGTTFTFSPPSGPPNCANIVSPLDLATNVGITSTLNWSAGTGGGVPTGYKLYFGTDNPPTNIVNGTNIGLVNSYDPSPDMAYSTTYYWKIVPTNGSGDASGCVIVSFTTGADPSITGFPYCESFDATTFAPYGWTNVKTAGTGTPGIWDRQTVGTSPACTPHSGAAMARYNSYSLSTGTTGILVTPPINFPADNYKVDFWFYRDGTGYLTNADRINVYYNTVPNTTGATLLGTINRSIQLAPVVAATGWYEYDFQMPAGAAGNGRYVIFEAVSAWGNNMFLDDVCLFEYSNATLSYYNLQWPDFATIDVTQNTTVYAQCWQGGVTEPDGPGLGIECWIGYSTTNATVVSDFASGWNWVSTSYNYGHDPNNNDEYMANLGAAQGLGVGTYYYVSRFRYLGGPFTYGGYPNGAWDGTTQVSGVLTVNPIANDDCAGAIAITEVVDMPFSTVGSLQSGVNPGCGGTTNPYDIWYAYTANYSGEAIFDLCGSGYDTRLALYDACGGTALMCNDDACGLQSGFFYTVAAGNTYYLQIGGYNAATGSGYLSIAFDNTTWTGAAMNEDWWDQGNWNLGVPGSSTSATIPGGLGYYPDITGAAVCYNLNMGSNSTLLDNSNLSIYGTVSIERTIGTNQYHSFSPSVSGLTADVFKLGSSGIDVYLYGHNEINNADQYDGYFEIVPVTTPLATMAGYAVYPDGTSNPGNPTEWTFVQTGGFNTGAFGAANNMTRTGAGAFAGFNYVGNPYPSFIDWDAALGWDKTQMNATIWIENAGNWADYTSPGPGNNGGNNIIAPGQGFFVEVNNSFVSGTIMMDNDVRTNSGTPYLKSSPSNYVQLIAEGNGKTDETVVRFDENATVLFDGQYDGVKLAAGDAGYPQIYSITDRNLAYNALPAVDWVQLGFHSGIEEAFTISIKDINEISNVWLEDTFTGIFTNITNNSYTFDYTLGDDVDRFILHFTPLAVTENPADLINIYSSQKDVYVSVPANTEGDIVVYNLMGQEVARTIITDVLNKVSLEKSAYYVVKVMSNESVVTKKVFVK